MPGKGRKEGRMEGSRKGGRKRRMEENKRGKEEENGLHWSGVLMGKEEEECNGKQKGSPTWMI